MNKPKISVLVPTYNRPQLLNRTVNSIIEQSYENIEIVVVNDAGEYPMLKGHKGQNIDYIKFYQESFIQNHREFKYIENEKNKGLAGTRNVAIQACTGDYICLLDDDDIFLPYTLEFRMNMMEKLKAEIVYTRALRDVWDKDPATEKYISKGKQLYWDSPFDKDLILIQNIAPCCCPLFSRKAWNNSGNYLFDEKMTTTEDHDFWIALSRKTDFHELKLVDCECSYRLDKTQMTGRDNFLPNWIITFKRWRHTAKDLKRVTESQNRILKQVGANPEDYGL